MKICIRTGDVPEFPADVLVSTANPWLDMSGGVNGAIRVQCPEIQDELKSHLKELDIRALPAGSTVRTSAGTLPFQAILHAIAIDPFYSTSKQIINGILNELMVWTVPQGLHSISMPPWQPATVDCRWKTSRSGSVSACNATESPRLSD